MQEKQHIKKNIIIQEVLQNTTQQVTPKINNALLEQFYSLSLVDKIAHLSLFKENVEQNKKKEEVRNQILLLDSKEQPFFQQVWEDIEKYEDWKKNEQEKISIEFFDTLEEYQQSSKLYSQINLKPQKQESNSELDKQQKKNYEQTLKEKISAQTNQQEIGKFDVLFDSKEQLLLQLSQFRIDSRQEDAIVSKITFSYQESQAAQEQEQKDAYILFNYKFDQDEIKILRAGCLQVNSNIVNAYANYLMMEDEKNYFKLSKRQRPMHKRLFIFRSELVTDCALDQQYGKISKELLEKKYLYVWLKYLEDFKAIQYQFWLIYKRVGLIVNVNNFHWYFIQMNIEDRQLTIYDSQKCEKKLYQKPLILMLNQIFSEITRTVHFQFDILYSDIFQQQNDGYSCGYYACIAAEYLSQQSKGRMKTLPEMKSILQELLLPKENKLQ